MLKSTKKRSEATGTSLARNVEQVRDSGVTTFAMKKNRKR